MPKVPIKQRQVPGQRVVPRRAVPGRRRRKSQKAGPVSLLPLVKGEMSILTQAAEAELKQVMEQQLLDLMYQITATIVKRDGVLEIAAKDDCDKNDNGHNWIPALPAVAHVVRRASLDFHHLNGTSGPLVKSLANFASRANRLTHLRVSGGCTRDLSVVLGEFKGPLRQLVLTEGRFLGGKHQTQFLEALQKLTSLRELQLLDCSPACVRLIVQGLTKHANLRTVRLACPHNAASAQDVCQWIAELPQLESFENALDHEVLFPCLPKEFDRLVALRFTNGSQSIPAATTSTSSCIRSSAVGALSQALRRYPKLKELELHVDDSHAEYQGHMDDFWATAANLPNMETLTTNIVDLGYIVARSAKLRRLSCPYILPASDLQRLTNLRPNLKSLEFAAVRSVPGILRIMKTNQSVTELKLQSYSTFGNEVEQEWRNMLVANTTLMHLSLSMLVGESLMLVLAEILQDDACVLESLTLQGLDCGSTALFRALPTNTKLTSLSLQYEYGMFCLESWTVLVESLPHWGRLQEFCLDFSGSREHSLEDFAVSLLENRSLTHVQLTHDRKEYQHECNYICRQTSRRNRIGNMVRQGQMSRGLWPRVLESLGPNPSALYLASNFWLKNTLLVKGPIPTGKRKRSTRTRSMHTRSMSKKSDA